MTDLWISVLIIILAGIGAIHCVISFELMQHKKNGWFLILSTIIAVSSIMLSFSLCIQFIGLPILPSK